MDWKSIYWKKSVYPEGVAYVQQKKKKTKNKIKRERFFQKKWNPKNSPQWE